MSYAILPDAEYTLTTAVDGGGKTNVQKKERKRMEKRKRIDREPTRRASMCSAIIFYIYVLRLYTRIKQTYTTWSRGLIASLLTGKEKAHTGKA